MYVCMALTVYNVLDESLILSPMPVLKIILNFLTRDKSGTSEGALDDIMISLGKSKHPLMFNMNDEFVENCPQLGEETVLKQVTLMLKILLCS